jgi:DNA-binding transcriptional LysR family regulator
MNDSQIKSFTAAVKYMSFTKAAAHLYVTQSVLSKHIAALERELGVSLFDRSKKTIELTEAGRIFADCVDKMHAVYREAIRDMRHYAKDTCTLSMGLLEGQSIDPLIRKIIVNVRGGDERRRVQYEYFPQKQLIEALQNDEADLVITAEALITPIPQGMNVHLIRESGTHLVLPADHPLAARGDLKLSDIKDEVFIVIDRKRYPMLAKLQSMVSAKRNHPNMRITAPNFETMALWVETKAGVTIAASWDRMLNNPRLASIELKELDNIREIVVWKKNNSNPLLDVFIREIDKMASDFARTHSKTES